MELFLTKIPSGRYTADTYRSEKDTFKRNGRIFERFDRLDQKPAISFMVRVQNSLKSLIGWRTKVSAERNISRPPFFETFGTEATWIRKSFRMPLESPVEKFGIRPSSIPEHPPAGICKPREAVTNCHIQAPAEAIDINPVSPDNLENRADNDAYFNEQLCKYRQLSTREMAFIFEDEEAFDKAPDEIFSQESDETFAEGLFPEISANKSSPKPDWMDILTTCSLVQQYKSERATAFQIQLDKVLDGDMHPADFDFFDNGQPKDHIEKFRV